MAARSADVPGPRLTTVLGAAVRGLGRVYLHEPLAIDERVRVLQRCRKRRIAAVQFGIEDRYKFAEVPQLRSIETQLVTDLVRGSLWLMDDGLPEPRHPQGEPALLRPGDDLIQGSVRRVGTEDASPVRRRSPVGRPTALGQQVSRQYAFQLYKGPIKGGSKLAASVS